MSRRPRALLIGIGGLGSPAAEALARSGACDLVIVDDDRVDATNLHRQTLFDESEIGRSKAHCAKSRLEREHGVHVEAIDARFLPDNAFDLLRGVALVVEGADNFATKFLAADACAIARVPIVQAGAVRWNGWALACVPRSTACLRCVFEDIPRDRAETCAEAGVLGAVVGVVGALEAWLAIGMLEGRRTAGHVYGYRAIEGSLRRSAVRPRPDCPLCRGDIDDLRIERYAPPSCDIDV